MTASTMFNMGFRPSFGRQNGQRGGKGWTPKTAINSSHYLQVDMGEVRYVWRLKGVEDILTGLPVTKYIFQQME